MSELKTIYAEDTFDEDYMEYHHSDKRYYREVYLKSKADKVIAELKADYKEACDRLQTANLIKDEQKAKADKLLSCLKYLVIGDLIKDCPPKKVATEIVKEYDNGLG